MVWEFVIKTTAIKIKEFIRLIQFYVEEHAMNNLTSNMPWTILPRRNRRCALSATDTWKPEEEKDTRGVTCFMEENKISLHEVARFDEYKRD